jgi:hypothetical protein
LLRQIYEKTVELRKQHDAEAAEAAKAKSRSWRRCEMVKKNMMGLRFTKKRNEKDKFILKKSSFFSPGNFGASAVNKGIQREKLIRNCDPKASFFGHVQYLIMKKYDNSWAPLI